MFHRSGSDSLWIILALIIGAIEPILSKYGLRGSVGPLQIFVVRNVVAALVLMPVLLSSQGLSWQNLRKIFPAAVLLMLTGFCTLVALKFMTAVTVITVVTTTPAIVALLNQRLGKDMLGPKFWIGFCLAFVGVIISLELESFKVNPWGLVCVVLAVFSSSFYRVKMEDISEEFTPVVASALSFVAIAFLTGIFFFPVFPTVPLESLPVAIGIGASAALANAAFIVALNRVGATRLSIVAMVQRPLLILAAALILREQPTTWQLLGIVLVVIGMNFAKVTRLPKQLVVTMPPVAQTEL
jgi:drug/metabolite transporter (DMT)-like permease